MRDHRFDNIKFFLIFFVVFGHMLELIADKTFTLDLYRVIYSFHMPAFIFVSGYFAKFVPKKLASKLIWVYVLFQVVYIAFDRLLFVSDIPFQLLTPYWLMWYMLAMVFYYCLIPFIQTSSNKARTIIIITSVVISLLCGYDNNINRFLSLSRTFTFLPYFIVGYYLGHDLKDNISKWLEEKRRKLLIPSITFVVVAAYFVMLTPSITPEVLYGASSYEIANYTPFMKFLLIIVASSFIFLFITTSTSKKIPIVTMLGANTLSIYILHGFIVRFLSTTGIYYFDEIGNLVLALIVSSVLVVALGSQPVSNFFNRYCTATWFEKLISTENNSI